MYVSFLKIYFTIPFSHVLLYTHLRNYGQQMGARQEAGGRKAEFRDGLFPGTKWDFHLPLWSSKEREGEQTLNILVKLT